jgi:hypothetical protein
MYTLTSTEIKNGVLCTDLCIHNLRKEANEYNKQLRDKSTQVQQFMKEINNYTPHDIKYKWNGYNITIQKCSNYIIQIDNTSYSFLAIAINASRNILALIVENDGASVRGREDNLLLIFKNNKKVAEIPSVSKEVAVHDNHIYYIGESIDASRAYHHYSTLYSYSLYGNVTQSIFVHKNPSHMLHLASDLIGMPYLAITTYNKNPEVYSIFPSIKKSMNSYYIGNETEYACIVHRKPVNHMIASNDSYVIYIKKGVSTLTKDGKKLLEVLGWIDPLKTGFDDFLVRPIERPAFLYSSLSTSSMKSPSYLQIEQEKYRVPIITVSAKGNQVDNTLIVFYGAYGLRTRTTYPLQYWAPLLSRGWRICFVLARGGGDNGSSWAAEGRSSYHKNTINDVIDSINYIKEKYKCVWERTAIYARSAGGIPAGIVTLMGLVGMSFMEHPFVDVVATMGNPALPLTAVEYGEFGNPAKVDLREVSPMDCVKCVGPAWNGKKTRVLLRTGERDTQVYPYEPLKFAKRLRNLGHAVLLDSEEREGHFYGSEAWLEARAKDLVLLDSWADEEKISGRDIKMAMTHRNKTARRNKNKNKNSQRNKDMEGGKRRKSRKASRRTRRRVGRKH